MPSNHLGLCQLKSDAAKSFSGKSFLGPTGARKKLIGHPRCVSLSALCGALAMVLLSCLDPLPFAQANTPPQLTQQQSPATANPKPADFKKVSRRGQTLGTGTLTNQLEYLVVSDPRVRLMQVGLVVKVGHQDNPPDKMGLAHFLEHMVFGGNSKYPKDGEFAEWVGQRGGERNAHTASDHTLYKLAIPQEFAAEALDRFSQMFVEPSLNDAFAAIEINNVHSEYEIARPKDSFGMSSIFGLLAGTGHPDFGFHVGSRDSLRGVGHADLLNYFKATYSPERMKLAIIAPQPVEELKALVETNFQAIPDRGLGPKPLLSYPTPWSQALDVTVQSRQNNRKLRLDFPLSLAGAAEASRPEDLLGTLIGTEGHGSLIESLRRQGLIFGAGAGAYNREKKGFFVIDFTLSADGDAKIDTILTEFFAYVGVLKKVGLSEKIFKEHARMGALNLDTIEVADKGFDQAEEMALLMFDFPPLLLEESQTLYPEYRPELVLQLLNDLRPETMRVSRLTANLEESNAASPVRIEPYSGIRYQTSPLPENLIVRLKSESQGNSAVVAAKGLAAPGENPLIPWSIAKVAAWDQGGMGNTKPRRLNVAPQLGEFWFLQETRPFLQPKASFSASVYSPWLKNGIKEVTLTQIWLQAFFIERGVFLSDVNQAGLSLELKAAKKSPAIAIDASGISENLDKALLQVFGPGLSQLQSYSPSKAAFDLAKELLTKSWQKRETDQSVHIALDELSRLMSPTGVPWAVEGQAIKDATWEDAKNVARNLFAQVFFKALLYGNVSEAQVKNFENLLQPQGSVAGGANPGGSSPATVPENDISALVDSRAMSPTLGHAALRIIDDGKMANSAQVTFYNVGERTLRSTVLAAVIALILSDPYYEELRSQQSLGYTVQLGAQIFPNSAGIVTLIESSAFPSEVIRQRSEEFLGNAASAILATLTPATFEGIRTSYKTSILREAQNMPGVFAKWSNVLFNRGAILDYHETLAAEADKVTLAELQEFVTARFSKPAATNTDPLKFPSAAGGLAGQLTVLYKGTSWTSDPLPQAGEYVLGRQRNSDPMAELRSLLRNGNL